MQRSGKATYWVVLQARPDLRRASSMSWKARGEFVADSLRTTAAQSQAGVQALLRGRGVAFKSFWGANVIRVTSDAATLDALARRPEVQSIQADRTYHVVEAIPSVSQATVQTVEWNIANIRADQVWSTFGDRGEGVVVATIDTGVQYNHPALVNQYRGNLGGGSFDHNYNWYDPANVCPGDVPCDNVFHGTHTMGTILGDDGAGNQIGVAPGARWIAAKGCESNSCSTQSLLNSGQWMLAPTDLSGNNADPSKRPDIVSNSWGNTVGGDTFYQTVVQNWVAAGIFPVFANGNSGPGCSTVGSPGSYPESYGVGAYDINNAIASFSSRGPSPFSSITKPNISAPGVNVRSSVPTNSYAAYNGTSMATPHIAGVVALMWSAAAALVGDIAQTRQILDNTAIDTNDTSCGGTAANNDVFGQGRVDAYEAVNQSPRGPTGVVQGTVRKSADSSPLAGMMVHAVGPGDRTTTTNGSGGYSLTLPVGTYDVTVSGFGYVSQTATGLAVTNGGTLTHDFSLTAAPTHTLSGHVRDSNGNPLAGAKVTLLLTPLAPATTDGGGAYSFASVPDGTYNVQAQMNRCLDSQTQPVTLSANQSLDFALALRKDLFGYSCAELSAAWVNGTAPQALTGDDNYLSVALPFTFSFYGTPYANVYVTTNGYLSFNSAGSTFVNSTIPNPGSPNAAIDAFWDDMWMDGSSTVKTDTLGVTPNRRFVVEWDNVGFFSNTALRVDFETVLYESGDILTQYRNISLTDGMAQGNSATFGIENATGSDGLQYASGEAAVHDGLAVRYSVSAFTGVSGVVTDANDGLAIQGATVRALQGGNPVNTTTTDAGGGYQLSVGAGSYMVDAAKTNYETASNAVVVAQGQGATQNFALKTGKLTVTPGSLSFTPASGQQQTQSLTVSDSGVGGLTWSLSENGGDVPWLSETPTGTTLAAGGSQTVQVTVNAALMGSLTGSATLDFQSNGAKQATAHVTISATVSPYQQRVNVGGPAVTTSGNAWTADRAFTAGSWGYTNSASTTYSVRKAISGTLDDVLYQNQRLTPTEYRFTVPNGTYQVQLMFAELKRVKVGARVFDVNVEGTSIANVDIVRDVGLNAADVYTRTVTVSDGVLNVIFTPHAGSQAPVVNALWVLQQ
jgi:subtilisin family serine protease